MAKSLQLFFSDWGGGAGCQGGVVGSWGCTESSVFLLRFIWPQLACITSSSLQGVLSSSICKPSLFPKEILPQHDLSPYIYRLLRLRMSCNPAHFVRVSPASQKSHWFPLLGEATDTNRSSLSTDWKVYRQMTKWGANPTATWHWMLFLWLTWHIFFLCISFPPVLRHSFLSFPAMGTWDMLYVVDLVGLGW